MDIVSRIENQIAIVYFSGQTLGEPADSKEFETQLKDLIDKKVKLIILDLHDVNRINSTGLAILITATTLFTDCVFVPCHSTSNWRTGRSAPIPPR